MWTDGNARTIRHDGYWSLRLLLAMIVCHRTSRSLLVNLFFRDRCTIVEIMILIKNRRFRNRKFPFNNRKRSRKFRVPYVKRYVKQKNGRLNRTRGEKKILPKRGPFVLRREYRKITWKIVVVDLVVPTWRKWKNRR